MDAKYSQIDSKELAKLQICAPIANYHAKFVTIEVKRNGKKIDDKSRYYVEFRPNFFSNAMAQRALRRITKYNYENFMVNFTRASLPNKTLPKHPNIVNIDWLNKNVGANGPQSQAIKSILNRTSFPAPYLIFGPPGMALKMFPSATLNFYSPRNWKNQHTR